MDNKGKVKKEVDGSLPPPRKGGLKFAPKVPPKKAAKVVPKTEPADESKDETVDKELLMKLKTSQSTDPFLRKVKAEKKEMRTQVAFGQGNSSYARSFPMPGSSTDGSASKLPKEFVEPWDYTHSDYPITLPLRRPYSGDPEILNEEEFGESSAARAQDGELTAAEELGLMDRSDEPQLLFFQMPASLPLPKQPDSVANTDRGTEGAEPASTSSKVMHPTRPSTLLCSKLTELPGGFMGKILVYKSGKVKMKIGDTLFDVSPGSNCMFVQEVAAINTREKHCCTLGEISKRAIVTPDVEHLLDSLDKMEA
uniref:RNA polymerase III subunit C4 n=1 Tax=Leersia perrieri TaxID=77586 RepID=A0A0D9W4B8_9ORYZ